MRKPRPGELTCNCNAYKFPHRFGGGRCRGNSIVYQAWAENFGSGPCSDCLMNMGDHCQVDQGQESPAECPIWQEQVQLEGVRLLGSYWRQRAKRSPGSP